MVAYQTGNPKVAGSTPSQGKLFAHICLCYQAVQFGTSLIIVNVTAVYERGLA